jgi:hypothetical protein
MGCKHDQGARNHNGRGWRCNLCWEEVDEPKPEPAPKPEPKKTPRARTRKKAAE